MFVNGNVHIPNDVSYAEDGFKSSRTKGWSQTGERGIEIIMCDTERRRIELTRTSESKYTRLRMICRAVTASTVDLEPQTKAEDQKEAPCVLSSIASRGLPGHTAVKLKRI